MIFKPALSLSSFTLIKRLFSSSLLSAIRIVSSTYPRLVMFLLPISIPACNSSSWHFSWCTPHVGYTTRLNNQTALLYPSLDLEPISCYREGSNCCFLTHIQVSQETSEMVWYAHFFKSFPQLIMIHTVKGFSEVNEVEVDVFLKVPCFLYYPWMLAVWSLVPLPFLNPACLDIWKFLVHIMLNRNMQDFKHDLTSMGDECNCPKYYIPSTYLSHNWKFVPWLLTSNYPPTT